MEIFKHQAANHEHKLLHWAKHPMACLSMGFILEFDGVQKGDLHNLLQALSS